MRRRHVPATAARTGTVMTRAKPEGATILIVEDHEAMRAMLRVHVQSGHPDWVILEAADGASALATCRKHPPRLILMDISLPDIDGIELTSRVKELVPDAVVIVVSQHGGPAYIERARAMGAFAYVTKDRIFQDLLTSIASALSVAPGTGKKEAP
jgi:DNA-binding NarL/FixJ family response regulator